MDAGNIEGSFQKGSCSKCYKAFDSKYALYLESVVNENWEIGSSRKGIF